MSKYEQTVLFAGVGEGHPADVQPFGDGSPQPSSWGRPVGAGNPEHGAIVANPPQHGAVGQGSTPGSCWADVVGGVRTSSGGTNPVCDQPTTIGHLGLLGTAAKPQAGEVRPKSMADGPCWMMRPVDLTRLLNSTHFGPVIDERQLYRHRMRAGFRISDGRRVDLFRYIAWLVDERHLGPRRRRRRCSTDTVSFDEVLELLRRQNYRCALSGRQLTPDSAALDHILPISRGGAHRIENAQILHKEVNRAKGTLTNGEFLRLCREVVAHAESDDHKHMEVQHAG